MHRSSAAVSFARALLALSRARKTGVLTARTTLDAVRVAIVDGVVRAARAERESELLGDVLLREGDLDVEAHLRALCVGAAEHPVGQWLVRAGAATRPAVEHALRDQLRARLLRVFEWPAIEYTLVSGSADVGVPWVSEPIATCDIVLSALRTRVGEQDVQAFLVAHASSALTLSSLGAWLLRDAALWPDEAALVWALATDEGVLLATLRQNGCASVRSLRTLTALYLLGAVVPRVHAGASYPVLLRKQRQIRRRASPAELLDLHADARTGEARRALRRLAQSVHPDALGPQVPLALRQASTEVMTGLARAERELRVATGVGRRVR